MLSAIVLRTGVGSNNPGNIRVDFGNPNIKTVKTSANTIPLDTWVYIGVTFNANTCGTLKVFYNDTTSI